MARNPSRRSSFVGGMSWAAKAWLGLAALVAPTAGCGDDTPSGSADMVRPTDGSSAADMPVVKYGGPPDMATPADMPVVKYGGPPDMATPHDLAAPPQDMPVVKYGGPPDLA